MRVTLVTESLAGNSLGRAWALWEMCAFLGWEAEIISVHGEEFWPPLRGTEFERHSRLVSRDTFPAEISASRADLVIAVKPLVESLGLVLQANRRIPILLDVDDPDLEVKLSLGRPHRAAAKWILRFSMMREYQKLANAARSLPTIVSNPWLQSRYGGMVIPHARVDQGVGSPHSSETPSVSFVGSTRGHKGIEQLRLAVAGLQERSFSLTVTDDEPTDARAWETWTGVTTIDEGRALVQRSDIIAIPSLRTINSRGQLPAKLIDAMIAGRALVVSDVDPMPWAVGKSAIRVEPGSVKSLQSALESLADPAFRSELGAAARAEALERFTVQAIAPVFAEACQSAVVAGAR